jgi:hypothetical protein
MKQTGVRTVKLDVDYGAVRVVIALAGHDCDLCRSGDGVGPGLGGVPDDGWPVRGAGRHRAAGLGPRVAATTHAVLTYLLTHDLALLSAVVLIVAGFVFNALAVLLWSVLDNNGAAWLCSTSGIVMWMFACGILCVYLPRAASRHAKRR